MDRSEVIKIIEEYMENYNFAISKVVSFKPKMKTKEVLEYLGCDRHWLYNNKSQFGGERKNLRGDYQFDTDKVVNYKLNKLR